MLSSCTLHRVSLWRTPEKVADADEYVYRITKPIPVDGYRLTSHVGVSVSEAFIPPYTTLDSSCNDSVLNEPKVSRTRENSAVKPSTSSARM
jgi:hypothetical protein